ncbi:MAG: hypothetical protein GTN71_06340, partial [Anaerolineae bacterium]|nr:hypothetical protein [Anaerolineae bacterium]
LAVPDILAKVRAAEAEGMDAVIIDCMADPGLSPARELASIPIVGPAQTAMHLAAILAHRFSVLTVLERDIPLIDRLARLYGLESNLASVRPVNIPVLELDRDRERLVEALVEQSARAVAEDGAHIIFFGCTGMMGSAQQVEQALAERGYSVPVIDPSLAALKLAEGLVDMGLSHSKRTYPPPPPKEVVGYPHLQGASDGPAQKLLAPVPGAPSHLGELRRRARIRVIIPVVGEHWIVPVQEAYGRAGRPGTEISAVAIDRGPASIESVRDEALAIPGVLSKVRAAEAGGDGRGGPRLHGRSGPRPGPRVGLHPRHWPGSGSDASGGHAGPSVFGHHRSGAGHPESPPPDSALRPGREGGLGAGHQHPCPGDG